MAFQKPKGTVDFYPEEQQAKEEIFRRLKTTAERYNFRQVESPVFEELSVLTEKEGEEIVSQIFTLEERSKERFGLRFDMTVPLARMFIARQKEMIKPVKWFYLSRNWRYEAPQKGRLREFYQFGVELFGPADPRADAEVINLAIDSLLSLGLKIGDFYVYINDRDLLSAIIRDIAKDSGLGQEEMIRIIDKKEKVSEKEFREELQTIIPDDKIDYIISLFSCSMEELQEKDLNDEAKEALSRLLEVLSYIDPEFIRFSLSTSRGLAYYTGTVFEIFDKDRKFRSICGGGRYDNMIRNFGGQDTPATGFGMGYSTLCLLLQDKGLMPSVDSGPEYFIAAIGADAQKKAIEIASGLRKKTSCEISLSSKNIKNQLKYANNINARNVIVIGGNEIKQGKVKVKDMSSGKETEKQIDSIL
jgi:histidyl-tRNA synthetase